MDSQEVAPLVVAVADDEASPPRRRNHANDIHILSFAFLFIFSAYGAAQNLETTVNTEEDLGTISLGILYTSFTVFSVVASLVVRALGSKRALILGSSGYLLFIASNLKPSWYTMVPASLYLGFTASIIWVGQGTYLTSAARSHAKDCQLHEGTIIGSFNGEFWGMFAAHQVIGNLISLALLRDGKGGDNVSGTNVLFTVFLVSMVLGVILMCFISKNDDKEEDLIVYSSVGSLLKTVIAPMLQTKMMLIIPLFAYSGLQQAFVWAVFTKHVVTPALGVSGVGGAMAVYGAADVICSFIAGRFTSSLSSITLIVPGGAILQALILLWLLLGYRLVWLVLSYALTLSERTKADVCLLCSLSCSLPTGVLCYVYPLLMAAIWGVGDGVFNTQLSALLGMLFKHDMEASFAQLKLWQSASIALVFFLSPYITLQAMLILMAAGLCIAVSSFLYLALCCERSLDS